MSGVVSAKGIISWPGNTAVALTSFNVSLFLLSAIMSRKVFVEKNGLGLLWFEALPTYWPCERTRTKDEDEAQSPVSAASA